MQKFPHFESRPITNHIQKVKRTSFPATSPHLPAEKTNYTCKTRTYSHKAGKHTHTHTQIKTPKIFNVSHLPNLQIKSKFTQSTAKQFFGKKKKKKNSPQLLHRPAVQRARKRRLEKRTKEKPQASHSGTHNLQNLRTEHRPCQ